MRPGKNDHRQGGFTYVAMLFALAIFGVGLAAVGESWSAASHRLREEELIQIGSAYVRAIGTYYQRSPGAQKTYPARLDDLLEDPRFAGTERYLRRLYRDPFSPLTSSDKWGLIKAPDGGIAGIYSLSELPALRRQPLMIPGAVAVSGARYSEWKFVYQGTP